jgi:hypothetical protein
MEMRGSGVGVGIRWVGAVPASSGEGVVAQGEVSGRMEMKGESRRLRVVGHRQSMKRMPASRAAGN